jgi:6-phospho-3-hexuloisomerase
MTTVPDLATLRTALLIELDRTLNSIDPEPLAQLRSSLREAPRIFVAGKGRSGLVMRAFAMRLMHLGRPVYIVDDVTTPAITQGDLLVIGSGSGRTVSLVQYAARAAEVGANVVLVTSAAASPIHEHARCVLHLTAPTPKRGADHDQPASLQPMGSLFEQAMLLLLDMLIIQLMYDLDQDPERMFRRHANLE